MTEILFIIIQIFYFIFLSLYPINVFHNKEKSFLFLNYSFGDKLSLNIIIQLNILLILSLFKLSLVNIFYIHLLTGIIYCIYYYLNKKKKLTENFYYILIIFILTFFLSVNLASNLVLGWDSEFRWIVKALNFFQDNKVDNLQLFTDNEYPFLGSLVWGYFWKNSFYEFEYFGRMFYIYYFILSIFSLSEILKIKFIYKICFSVSLVYFGFKYSNFNGYQDILIFSTICLLSKFFYNYLFVKNKKINFSNFNIIIFLLIFNVLFWIKHEGMVYSFFFLILFIFFSRDLKANINLAIFFIFILIFKIIVYHYLNLPFVMQGETYNKSFFEFEFLTLLSRFFLVSKFYLIFLFDNILMLFGLVSLMLLYFFNKSSLNIKYFTLFFLLNMSFIYGSHLFMNLQNFDYWIKYSVGRFILHTTGFYLLAFLIFCNIRLPKFLK